MEGALFHGIIKLLWGAKKGCEKVNLPTVLLFFEPSLQQCTVLQ